MALKKSASEKQPSSQFRPPVVVVLGHVDHGKTTLLDAIRKTDVASREHGGITQGIGAYQVQIDAGSDKKITFIDTPGHEAFSAMRSRGTSVADIAILVVAANDSVMPQTVESIKIIKEAKIPYIVTINKIDLPEANIDKVIKDLGRHEVSLETYGGDVPFIKISAKKGEGIKELLDLIALVADLAEIKGDPGLPVEGIIIESRMDKNRGPLATTIVKNGILRVGDKIFAENKEAKVRALVDYQGKKIDEAGPGTPVEILGLSFVPAVGTKVRSFQGEDDTVKSSLTKTSVGTQGSAQTLNLILKADTLGSLEAILTKIPENTALLQSGVGEINEADILLARSTRAIILGFNVKVTSGAEKLAEVEKVLVRTYKIIYELLDELSDAASGMLEPLEREEELGKGEIIAEFPFEKMRVCGTKVTDGRIARGDRARVLRGEEVIGEAKVKSVRVGKEEVNKAEKGKECGVFLEPQVDFRLGDDIISYRIV